MLEMLVILVVIVSVGYGTYTATSTYYQSKINLIEARHKVDLAKEFDDSFKAGYENGYQACKIDNLYKRIEENTEARKNQQ